MNLFFFFVFLRTESFAHKLNGRVVDGENRATTEKRVDGSEGGGLWGW